MNEWVWHIYGMIMKGENPAPVPFLSTTSHMEPRIEPRPSW